MGLEKLVQRGSLYGFGAGAATAGGLVFVASLFEVALGAAILVLVAVAVLALVLLLGAPGIGPGPAVGEMQSSTGGETGGMQMASPVEGGGASRNPADMAAVVPATRLEYVMYFAGFGVIAVVALAFLVG
jgi:hypothetical protein